MQIVEFYVSCCETKLFKLCPKLTRAHVDLTSFSRMNVKLAAQILSSSVAKGLDFKFGDQAKSLSKFICIMDKWFDCMNASSFDESKHTRKANRNPYSSLQDQRLEWLENEFPLYFEKWAENVENRPGQFTKKERAAMQLSAPTLKGLLMTTKSVVACIKFLLGKGAKFVLTSHFNQDPLEQFFGFCRHKTGHNHNPNVVQALRSANEHRVIGAVCSDLSSKRGNTQVTSQPITIDPSPLRRRSRPKRPRIRNLTV